MKKHIILIPEIDGMGGGQMYVRNKLSFVSGRGWESVVFSASRKKILIPDLQKYEDCIIDEMIVSPLVQSRKTIEKVISAIVEKIGDFDEAVVESNSVQTALWGELLAKRLNCKHMVFLLEEHLDKIVPEEYLDFYWFKFGRRELCGIANNSMKKLFRGSDKVVEGDTYKLSAACTNVVYESDEDPLNLPTEDMTLGCIGRLEKKYVEVAAKSFAEVAMRNPDKKFNVLIIGDSNNPANREKIRNIFEEVQNVNLIMPGALYPISSATLKKVSLFASSAGSAGVTYRAGIPTISIDVNDLMPIGVLGYTTDKVLQRTDEVPENLTNLIGKIIFENYLDNMAYNQPKPFEENVLDKHFAFMNDSEKTKEYFNVEKMNPAGNDKRKRMIRIILGPYLYAKLRGKWAVRIKNLIRKKV